MDLNDRADLLRRRLPVSVAALAFFVCLGGALAAGRASDAALAVGLAGFMGTWVVVRCLAGAAFSRTEVRAETEEPTEPLAEESS